MKILIDESDLVSEVAKDMHISEGANFIRGLKKKSKLLTNEELEVIVSELTFTLNSSDDKDDKRVYKRILKKITS